MKQEQDKLVMYGALHAARGALEVAWAHADPDSEGYRRLEAIHELVRLLAGDLARECGL